MKRMLEMFSVDSIVCSLEISLCMYVIHWIDRADKTWQRFEMTVIVMSLFKLKQVFSYAGLGSVLKFA